MGKSVQFVFFGNQYSANQKLFIFQLYEFILIT